PRARPGEQEQPRVVEPRPAAGQALEPPARDGGGPVACPGGEAPGLAAPAGVRAAPVSRGMRPRQAEGRAVLHDPELLLLDEPRSGLDPAAAQTVEPLIGRGSGRTRVVASHDPAGGLEEADLALGLRDGRAELLGPAAGFGPAEIGELYR
ncbi:MAG: ABC transporter ATP-binding protein, partial [Solirubrobacterales bacterium]